MPRDTAGRRRAGKFENIVTDSGVVFRPVSGRGGYTTYIRSDTGERVDMVSGTKAEAEMHEMIGAPIYGR